MVILPPSAEALRDLRGEGLDYHLLDYDDTRLHYRSPTEGGSSGSPVFDKAWNLIGLHHAGSLEMRRLHGPGVYPANEGIRLSAIILALHDGGL